MAFTSCQFSHISILNWRTWSVGESFRLVWLCKPLSYGVDDCNIKYHSRLTASEFLITKRALDYKRTKLKIRRKQCEKKNDLFILALSSLKRIRYYRYFGGYGYTEYYCQKFAEYKLLSPCLSAQVEQSTGSVLSFAWFGGDIEEAERRHATSLIMRTKSKSRCLDYEDHVAEINNQIQMLVFASWKSSRKWLRANLLQPDHSRLIIFIADVLAKKLNSLLDCWVWFKRW